MMAMYYEARGESMKTQRAVLDTVLNRSKAQGKSVCKVLSQRLQFPWWRTRNKNKVDFKTYHAYYLVRNMDRVLKDSDYLYFNSVRHPWCVSAKRIGGLTFCKGEIK